MRKLGVYILAITAASLAVNAEEKEPVIHLSSKGFTLVVDDDSALKQSLAEETIAEEPFLIYEVNPLPNDLDKAEYEDLPITSSLEVEPDQEYATIYPDFVADEVQETFIADESCTALPDMPICAPRVLKEQLLNRKSTTCTPSQKTYSSQQTSCTSFFDDIKVGVSAELLYWTSGPDQQIAITGNNANQIATRNLQTFNNNYQPGFRIGYNYGHACDPWQIGFIYTYAHDSNQRDFGADNFTDWATAQNPTSGTALYTDWTFNLNQVDLIVGREFFYHNYRSFLSVGGRYFRYNDGFKNYYSNSGVPSNSISMMNSLQAGGLVLGVDNRYRFDCGLFLDGNVKAGLVLGRIHLNYLGIRRDFIAPPSLIGVQSAFLSLSMIPVIDATVNLGWDFCLWDMDFTGHVGYEYHVWVNGFRALATALGDVDAFNVSIILPSNLFAHGVTAGLALRF